jgi:hypothetical protein
MVNAEELVNDPQFNVDYSPLTITDGYGEGEFGSETYGE